MENIEYVDEELLSREKVKTLIRSNPFDAKEERIQFTRIGNYFEYYSSGGTIFFEDIFEKMAISYWDEYPFPEKKILEIFGSGIEIRVAPID